MLFWPQQSSYYVDIWSNFFASTCMGFFFAIKATKAKSTWYHLSSVHEHSERLVLSPAVVQYIHAMTSLLKGSCQKLMKIILVWDKFLHYRLVPSYIQDAFWFYLVFVVYSLSYFCGCWLQFTLLPRWHWLIFALILPHGLCTLCKTKSAKTFLPITCNAPKPWASANQILSRDRYR